MEYSIKNDCLIVHPHGELDHHYADELKKNIEETALKYDSKNIIINFDDINFMDSSGIGMIVGRYKYTTRRGGITAAACVNTELKRLMLLSGLYRIIRIFDNVEEACKSIERSN